MILANNNKRPRKDYLLSWTIEDSIMKRTNGRQSYGLLRECVQGHRFLVPRTRTIATVVHRMLLNIRGRVLDEASTQRSGHRWRTLTQEAEGLESLARRVQNHSSRFLKG